ncbi:MAG: peptidoglycan editing factor PgeF [Oscillospiraceae bacterium]|nr:peptidoglycan editing factor PgeF [Oscillospiraceae bacterium]
MQTLTQNGVTLLKSHIIAAPHGFSTRHGGVSTQPHLASLNLGFNCGDNPANVAENYRRLATAAGVSEGIIRASQIHSARVATVDEEFLAAYDNASPPECDGFVTALTGVTLSVRTADCVPVLAHDPKTGVISAFHAGWRGAVGGILAAGVSAMEELGADVADICVAIGPCIAPCCFEVGEDFISAYTNALGSGYAQRFITNSHADLPATCVALLEETGVLSTNIDLAGECTCCNQDKFFSHRGSGGKRGLLAAVIG